MAAIDFDKGFDDYFANHGKVWKHDRSLTVGASEVFGCLRKAWYSKHKTPKDPDYEETWGALERGNVLEDAYLAPRLTWIVQQQTEKGRLNYAGQSSQRTFIDEKAKLSVTPDGLITNVDDDALALYGIPSLGGTGCFNIEFKTIDPRVNLREEKAQHRGQVQVQMGMTREQTRFKPKYAMILYLDASFLHEVDYFVVEFDQKVYDAAKSRARMVYETKSAQELLPEGKFDGACTYCPFRRACADSIEAATPLKGETNSNELPDDLQTEFERLLVNERRASAAVKELESNATEAKEELKAFIRDIGVKKLNAGDTTVSLFFQKGRKTLDVAALRESGVDVDQFYKQGAGFDVLRVSEKGARNAINPDG